MLTECELISRCQSSFQLLTFMVVIYKDEGATIDFCMNGCACHSEPAIKTTANRERCYAEGKLPKRSYHTPFRSKGGHDISQVGSYIRIKCGVPSNYKQLDLDPRNRLNRFGRRPRKQAFLIFPGWFS